MTIPSTKASTLNVDQGSDKISLARADIKQNIDNVNEIIDHLGEGNNTLYIPFGGLVVTQWSGTAVGEVDSANDPYYDGNRFYRMVTLGGAYYQRGFSDNPSLTAAATVYGNIPGASVTRATPTLVKPTGVTITGTNLNCTLSNGLLTRGGTAPSGATDGRGGSVNPSYHSHGIGYDNYVTLPAGTYALSIRKNSGTPYSALYDSLPALEGDNDAVEGFGLSEFWIYNRTDGSEITTSNTAPTSIGDITNWDTVTQFFTLGAEKQIQFFNHSGVDVIGTITDPDSAGNIGSDIIGISHTATITTGGYLVGTTKTYFLDTDGQTLPAKLGWYVPFTNVYLRLEKIA